MRNPLSSDEVPDSKQSLRRTGRRGFLRDSLTRAAAFAVIATALGLPSSQPAHAQDKKKKDDGAAQADEEKKPPEKTAEQKELEAIGAEFKAGDADALIARVPKKGKLRLELGSDNDLFSRSPAKRLLNAWFEKRKITQVKLKESKDDKALTGAFTLKFRKLEQRKGVLKDLTIRIKRKGTKFILHSIRVTSQ